MILFGHLGVNMKRCSVSLSFVNQEVYNIMYRYVMCRHMTSLQMTSALSDIQILSWIRTCICLTNNNSEQTVQLICKIDYIFMTSSSIQTIYCTLSSSKTDTSLRQTVKEVPKVSVHCIGIYYNILL